MVDPSQNRTHEPAIIPKSQKAKEYHQRVFLPRVLREIEKMNTLPVTVFVCGPSEDSQPLTQKKIDTVNELRRLGHNAIMGEELVEELSKQDKDAGTSVKTANTYELVGASKSDLIVVFFGSPGSIGEGHEFLSVSDIGQKTLIFIDGKYKDSYNSVGILAMHEKLHRPLEKYKSPDDIDNCILMGKVIDWVQSYQAAKLTFKLTEE